MRILSLSMLILGLIATVVPGVPANAEEEPGTAEVQTTAAPESSASKIPDGYVSVACRVQTTAIAGPISQEPIEPVSYPPVPTSDPNCICPGGGPRFVMAGDTCEVSEDGSVCTGVCVWVKVGAIGVFKFTECGTP